MRPYFWVWVFATDTAKMRKKHIKQIWKILKYKEILGEPIKTYGEWLGNGWGVSNLCVPSRGIPGGGLIFLKSLSLFIKSAVFLCFDDKTLIFIIKRPDPGCPRLPLLYHPSLYLWGGRRPPSTIKGCIRHAAHCKPTYLFVGFSFLFLTAIGFLLRSIFLFLGFSRWVGFSVVTTVSFRSHLTVRTAKIRSTKRAARCLAVQRSWLPMSIS